MIRRPPRSTQSRSSAASDVYKRQILVDGIAHPEEVFLEHRFLRADHGVPVLNDTHAGQHRDQRDDNHQFDEGEAGLGLAPTPLHGDSQHRDHQSLYFVPSSPVPVLFVKTSKTFWPPQLVASVSSWYDLMPHSLLFVIGSIGIRRRNLLSLI